MAALGRGSSAPHTHRSKRSSSQHQAAGATHPQPAYAAVGPHRPCLSALIQCQFENQVTVMSSNDEKGKQSGLSMDRAAFLLLRVKKAFKKKKASRKDKR